MKETPLENWIINKTAIDERDHKLLEDYQLKKIRSTLKYVKKNSRFYSEQLKNINEDNIKSFEDFRNIPFTLPAQIRHNSIDFLCVPQKDIKRIVTLNSSGTSGDEKRIYFTEEDLELTTDFFKVGMSCLTDKSDRVLVLLPGNSYGSIGDLLKKALERSETKCIVHGVMIDPEETIKCIEENNITCIVGIPMQVLYLSRLKNEIFKSKIKKVLLSTDYVPEVLIRELTEQGTEVFTHYGMTEMGYGGGVECQVLNGYHMREADLYFEIINPETGEEVQDGEMGEVVFTTLTRQAMPLVRYRTGDMAAFSENACKCGTFLKTMNRVLGRMDNRLIIGENNYLYLRELDELILSYKDILSYKACLKDKNLLNIEITTENKALKDKLEQSIKILLEEKSEQKKKVAVTVNPGKMPEKIVNSMVKRKLCDYRGDEL